MALRIAVPGGEVELIPRGSEVPESRQDLLLERINGIIATNWRHAKSTWWSREHSPFHDDFGMAFFHAAGQIVGYFIYRQLTLDDVPVFYVAGTAVDRTHQGRRCYQSMQARALMAAWRALDPPPKEVFVAWRTRNPAIWVNNSRYCRAVTPSLWTGQEDPKLQDACLRLARRLYPGCPIEPPMMIMRDVFVDFFEIRRPRRGPNGSIGARLAELLANPADAVFSLGVVEASTFRALWRPLEGRS